METIFTNGEIVPYSGVYRIQHDPPHTSEEAITLAEGSTFPLCVRCLRVYFILVNHLSESDLLVYSQEL
jgi:hypothetical protein